MSSQGPEDTSPSQVLRLASRSPRRAALLKAAGIAFLPGPYPDVDEEIRPGLAPAAVVCDLARQKLAAVRGALGPGEIALTADTLVARDGHLLGKPRDALAAFSMLQSLRGRRHEVLTGVAVGRATGPVLCEAAVTGVVFEAVSDERLRAYVATGEPLGKAGAYAVQGGAGAFVASLEGREDTVIGLPIDLVRALLATLG